MSETHIHIHLNGEQVSSTAATQTSSASSKKKAAPTSRRPTPKKRKASAYNRRYAAALKKIQHKHKTKAGSWKKGGYRKAVKEAHKLAKK